MERFFWFVVGTLLASFGEVLAFRFEKDGFSSSLRGRSECPHCNSRLKFWDLIPLFSFIFLSGRCRYCQKPIGWKYPVGELALGLLAVVLTYIFKNPPVIFFNLLIIFLLLVIAAIDWKTKLIVEPLVVIGAVLAALNLIFSGQPAAPQFIGLALGAGIFLILALWGKGRWMGSGDVEIAAWLGFWLGFPLILVALMGAFVSGSVYGVYLLQTKKATLKTALPFGPFLVFGGIFALLAGRYVIQWYLG